MPTISGIVKDSTGAFAQRMVRAYRRDTGALIGQTISNATTGAYAITTSYAGEHFVLMHDGTVTLGDPYWDNVLYACHFNGENNSTTFFEEKGATLTAVGNAKLTTTSPKFETACAIFDGSGDYISSNCTVDLSGSSDFTIEFWVYVDDLATYRGFLGQRTNNSGQGWYIYVAPDGTLTCGSAMDNLGYGNRSLGITVPVAQWVHIALVKTSTGYTGYVNGVAGTPLAVTGGFQTVAKTLTVGALGSDGELVHKGKIDDVIITKGLARYTTNFTPPTAAFLGVSVLSNGTENLLAFDRVTPV